MQHDGATWLRIGNVQRRNQVRQNCLTWSRRSVRRSRATRPRPSLVHRVEPGERESRPEENLETATRLAKAASSVTADDAHRLDSRIRLLSGAIGDNLAKLTDLIARAKDAEIHLALGYSSWTAYLASALGQLELAMNAPARRELVGLLTDEGMSQRAIAQAAGVSQATISRDQQVMHDASPAEPELEPESKPTRSPKLERRREWSAAGGWRAETDQVDTNVSTPATAQKNHGGNVFGLDGKIYTPKPRLDPKPSAPPRRRPIAEAFGDHARKVTQATGSLERLCQDERFAGNINNLTRNLFDLVRARDALDRTIARFDGTESARRIAADQMHRDVVDAEVVEP